MELHRQTCGDMTAAEASQPGADNLRHGKACPVQDWQAAHKQLALCQATLQLQCRSAGARRCTQNSQAVQRAARPSTRLL